MGFWFGGDGIKDPSMVKGGGPVFVGWYFGGCIRVMVVQCFIANKLVSPNSWDVGYLGLLEIYGRDFRGKGFIVESI